MSTRLVGAKRCIVLPSHAKNHFLLVRSSYFMYSYDSIIHPDNAAGLLLGPSSADLSNGPASDFSRLLCLSFVSTFLLRPLVSCVFWIYFRTSLYKHEPCPTFLERPRASYFDRLCFGAVFSFCNALYWLPVYVNSKASNDLLTKDFPTTAQLLEVKTRAPNNVLFKGKSRITLLCYYSTCLVLIVLSI